MLYLGRAQVSCTKAQVSCTEAQVSCLAVLQEQSGAQRGVESRERVLAKRFARKVSREKLVTPGHRTWIGSALALAGIGGSNDIFLGKGILLVLDMDSSGWIRYFPPLSR